MKNFKKVISVVMALAMIVCSFTAVSASDFADVAETAAYAEAVQVLKALGVVNGVEQENGTFNFEPEKTVTRAEAVTMIVGALNLADEAAAGTSQFADVNSQAAWAAGYVNVGVAQGFIAGYDANTFGPLDNVTYAQLCVMLTQITGYGEYAKAYGGWPTGYTTMAASAGINAGVAVAQDAALTKGQVAMMIWNALQAPMLGVDVYAINGNEYKQLDGSEGKYKTLFSEKFDGYVATVKIAETAANDGLDNDEAKIDLVKADWWPEIKAKFPNDTQKEDWSDAKGIEVFVAEGVDLNGYKLHTGKAVYLLDEDEEITIVYFAPTGRTASKEFAADTYYAQSNLITDKQYTDSHAKIRFGSSYYKFEKAIDVYVNGANVDTIRVGEADKLDWYLGNAQGTIKVLKAAKDAEDYDTIFVEFYQIARISSVEVDDDQAVIELDESTCLLKDTTEIDEIVIDMEDVAEGKTTVSVTRNGEAATLESLVNGDVIAYATNFAGVVAKEDIKEIKIIATNDTVSGTVTTVDKKDKTDYNDNVYTIGGADYVFVPDMSRDADPSIAITNSLDIDLDPFGRIFYVETNADSKNYAIALRLGTNEDEQIKLLLADGTTKTYDVNTDKCKDFADDFANINKETDITKRVITYKVSGKDGKITDYDFVSGKAFGKEYSERTNLLDGNKILDTTPIIKVDTEALNSVKLRESTNYTAFSKDDLVNGTKYDGYSYKIGTTVAFMVITEAGTSFGDSSRFAVAIDSPAATLTDDDEEVYSVKVLYEGEEQVLLFDYDPTDAIVGTAFFFETNSDGFVKATYEPGCEGWDKLVDTDDWSYTLKDEHKDIQFVTDAVIIEATSSSVTFATLEQINKGNLDTTKDIDDDYPDGVAVYSVADDCVAYTYDKNMNTKDESAKYDSTSVSSIRASRFSAFDSNAGILNDGIYAEKGGEGDAKMIERATTATVMIVDGEVVAIFATELR